MLLYEQLRETLTASQKLAIDAVWSHQLEECSPLPIRLLQRELGTTSVPDALSGLGGSVIHEVTHADVRCWKLTMLGALLSGHGAHLFGLLVRVLTALKEAFEKEALISEINNAWAKTTVVLMEQEEKFLFALLTLGTPAGAPFYLTQWTPDGSWQARVRDEITELYVQKDVSSYLDHLFLREYRPDEPFLEQERAIRALQSISTHGLHESQPDAVFNSRKGAGEEFVNSERLRQLAECSGHPYDLMRLIAMCRELNDSTVSRSCHAIIMLTRAILDHVPPIFGAKKFSEVANNYAGGGRSFQDAMKHLEGGSRKTADLFLHGQVRSAELLPSFTTVNFSAQLDLLLAEIARVSQEKAKAEHDAISQLTAKLHSLTTVLEENDLVCPHCKAPLIKRVPHTITGFVSGREVEAEVEYLEYECGLAVRDGESPISPCRSILTGA